MGYCSARAKRIMKKPTADDIKLHNIKVWTAAEKNLTLNPSPTDRPEFLRTAGLMAANRNSWPSTLLRLEEAVRHGVRDLQTLDTLGEAAYQAQSLQSLLPYQNLYNDPMIASHMARAFMLLGDITAAREFLNLAQDSLLKVALTALLGFEKNIESAMAAMLAPLSHPEIKNLNFIEFWQALAPVADVAGRKDIVALAETRQKALAYARPVTHYNQAMRLLADGEFQAAWKVHDWRLVPGSPCVLPTQFADISMWEGEGLAGKKILVSLENGFGDQIFSLRYLQPLINEGAHVEVAVGPEVRPLVESSFSFLKIHDLKSAEDIKYWGNQARPDFWIPCLSIPSRAYLDTPIGTSGYLKAPAELTQAYKVQIKQFQNAEQNFPVYGIVWHGDIRTAPMRTRAYSLTEFLQESGILNQPCVIVCLQKDATPEELTELETKASAQNCKVITAQTTLENFAHTAAWIQNLTKLFSCDTATAHLGGALGKPTTVLIRNKAIWHWRCDQTTMQSVWYQSCRVQYALAPKFSYMFDIRAE